MTNQEILEKAITQAIAGGFDGKPYWTVDFIVQGAAKVIYKYRNPPYEQIIFNHDFAKALWPEGAHTLKFPEGEIVMQSPLWQHHLQMMVIAPYPIKYLGENI